MPSVAEVIEANLDHLFSLEDVAGVAEGEVDGQPCIKIYLVQENTRTVLELPEKIDGIRLITEITGSFSKG